MPNAEGLAQQLTYAVSAEERAAANAEATWRAVVVLPEPGGPCGSRGRTGWFLSSGFRESRIAEIWPSLQTTSSGWKLSVSVRASLMTEGSSSSNIGVTCAEEERESGPGIIHRARGHPQPFWPLTQAVACVGALSALWMGRYLRLSRGTGR